jgi:hypothetical protein
MAPVLFEGEPGPRCKQPVSRILSRTAIPLGDTLLHRSSNLPGGFRRAWACAQSRNPRWRAGPARTRSRSGRAANFLPIWSCSVWGLPCPRRYRRGGALLPHLFTLTHVVPVGIRFHERSPEQRGRYLLCGTSRLAALTPRSRTLSGTLPCGVRTFLSQAR